MSLIDDLIRRYCPTGVEYRALGEVAECNVGGTPDRGNPLFWEGGDIRWMKSGEVNKGILHDTESRITQLGYESCSAKLVPAGSVVLALAGQGKTRGLVARTRVELCTNQSLCSITPRDGTLVGDFLYFFLAAQYQRLRELSSGDGGRGGLNLTTIRRLRVPVPPVELQLEIVRVLDKFQLVAAELDYTVKAELEARRQQYAHYRAELLSCGTSAEVMKATLGDVAEFTNGRPHERFVDPTGEILLMTSRFISTQGDSARRVKSSAVLTPAFKDQTALVMSDLPNGRALARAFFVEQDDRYAANQRVCLLRSKAPDALLPRFLYYILDRNPQLLRYDNGKEQTHLRKGQILGISVPIPPPAEQARIVAILDKLDVLVKELSAGLLSELSDRRTQYEYYRDRLVQFEEAV